jgi:ribonuclease E
MTDSENGIRSEGDAGPQDRGTDPGSAGEPGTPGESGPRRPRRRGGRGRGRTVHAGTAGTDGAAGTAGADGTDGADGADRPGGASAVIAAAPRVQASRLPEELPDRAIEGRVSSPEVAERVLVRRPPQIGDSRPAPGVALEPRPEVRTDGDVRKKRRRGGRSRSKVVETRIEPTNELDEASQQARRGRERDGKPIGRYLMCVHVSPEFTQVAVLEGRNLIEHYVSRPADDVGNIHGNIYLGKVTNVLPGMEAAFVDIATPKNAVLYRGDLQYDAEDVVESGPEARIEHILRPRQTVMAQVTKNPIALKGARLTQEVSLPGRFVVLVPNSRTFGISKRLPDDERKRLRAILDKAKPEQHGVIVRTAAEGVTADELRRDVDRLLGQWSEVEALAAKSQAPRLLYREPSMAVRVIREEFNRDYRGVVIDDRALYEDVVQYVTSLNPELADRVRFYDPSTEKLPLFETERVHEQLHKALDRKVWLPSGGSLIIEHTEALTVIDVNTGRNVGSSSLEETVFRNNLEAAEEIARQLRLRDIGGIIVIDFIDMEIRDHRKKVIDVFRDALARDKTRTQVFDISDLGLVEMTRKRIGEGLLTAFADRCEICDGRGVVVDHQRI